MSETASMERWSQFAGLLDHAMQQPAVAAVPEVMDVLVLLSEGVLQLAHDVMVLSENGRSDA